MPIGIVDTYTGRQALSSELESKLSKPSRTRSLAHAAAVTGLGGTGKTQLVLHHLEEHGGQYETILWINSQTEETTRSSYERCCNALGLTVQPLSNSTIVKDDPSVLAVLQWLQSRQEAQPWLVVVDNADDLSWDVGSIVPKGKAGTVVVTSQDAQASGLVGRLTEVVKVDVMESEEAIKLLFCFVEEYSSSGEDEWRHLIEDITELLDRMPLAIDLAGARIRSDVENGNDTGDALRQYQRDYSKSRDQLLRDQYFAVSSSYQKTVWTVWETTLLSLRSHTSSHTRIYPIELMSFLTFLDRANIQDDLFDLASLGIDESCRQLHYSIPDWMEALLTKGQDGRWNNYSYRATKDLLLRYGLVKVVRGAFQGTTMHSLVQWRARTEMEHEELWPCYVAFMAAVCVQIKAEGVKVHFRRYLVVHLPMNDKLLQTPFHAENDEQAPWVWKIIGDIWQQEGRSREAEELRIASLQHWQALLGEEHPDTLTAMADLASTYSNQGRWKEAEELEVRVMEASSRVLGEEHPETLAAMANLAYTLKSSGRDMLAIEMMENSVILSSKVLGHSHPDVIDRMQSVKSWAGADWNDSDRIGDDEHTISESS